MTEPIVYERFDQALDDIGRYRCEFTGLLASTATISLVEVTFSPLGPADIVGSQQIVGQVVYVYVNVSACTVGTEYLMSIRVTSSTGQTETMNKVIRVLAAVGTGYAPPPTTGEYAATLVQSGTNAPVATVLGNTLGGTVVWTRYAEGTFRGTLASAFTSGKTSIQVSLDVGAVGNESKVGRAWISSSIVELKVYDYADNLVDGFNGIDVTIKVFA
jgi:hypothetical protein